MKPTIQTSSRLQSLLGVVLVFILAVGLWAAIASQKGGALGPAATATTSTTPALSGYPGPNASPAVTGVAPAATVPSAATLLPDSGIRVGQVENLSNQSADLSFPPDSAARFAYPSTDGLTLVGIVASGQANPAGSVTMVDLTTGKSQKLADVRSAASPYISGQYALWNDLGKLMTYDRQSGKLQSVPGSDIARDASLSGSVVAWENLSQGHSVGILAYDLAAGNSYQVVKPALSYARGVACFAGPCWGPAQE